MSISSVAKKASWFGASVAGPLHVRGRMPNQDAWLGDNGTFGTLIVVCDGLGSKPNAREGARQACLAVREAARLWARSAAPEIPTLLRLLHLIWILRVAPATAPDSATTCLFALLTPGGRLVVAKLGDGLAAIRHADGTLELPGWERKGFGNETSGLGVARSMEEWEIFERHEVTPGCAIMLATDGVADDIEFHRIGDLISYLLTSVGPLPPRQRWLRLSRELRDWSMPHHTDDKTIAVLCVAEEPKH